MDASVVALTCRTSDSTPDSGRGAATLARLVAERLHTEHRTIGEPSGRKASFHEDLRDSRGCLLEAGGQVEDALNAGRVPLLFAGDCSISLTTLPTVARLRPDARVLWLDAHGDFNTPDTTESAFLGGMCLGGACGQWDTGFDGEMPSERVVLAGVRDLDARERELLERSPVTAIGSSLEALVATQTALDRAPVYVHLDLDVLDPNDFPAEFPTPGGLTPDKLYDLLEAVAGECEVVGVEVTAFEAPGDPDERKELAETALHVLEPLLGAAKVAV